MSDGLLWTICGLGAAACFILGFVIGRVTGEGDAVHDDDSSGE